MITYQKWFKISTKIKTNHQLLWEKYFSTKKCIANQFLYRTTILLQSETAFPLNILTIISLLVSEDKWGTILQNFLILQFTLITCDIFNSQFTSFDRISCLLIKHYKCDALSWADTNSVVGFDWQKVLYTDVANTYDRMTYQPPRTSW